MYEWVIRINNESNIHRFITEEFLDNHLTHESVSMLNWMKIFNSKIHLSNPFIIRFIDYIDWNWMTRPLDEALLIRYKLKIVQWNCQLYGKPLTFEFLWMNRM